jgi:radical SAM protein with 4Fe4S-binding SPASM domain
LIELANKLEIKDVIVHGFECYSKNLVNEVLYFKSEGSEEFFNKAKEKAQNYGISLQLPELKIKKRYSCDRDKSCLITWNGDVCPCTPLSYTRPVYLREKIIQLRKLSFGNVNMISFEEIWRSKDYESFRKYSDRTKYKHCKDCLMNFGVIVPQE